MVQFTNHYQQHTQATLVTLTHAVNMAEGDPPAALEQPHFAAVSINLPHFWPADPHVWFAQVRQFSTHRITPLQTKFKYIVASLSPDIVMEVHYLVLSSPGDDLYSTLKQLLVKRTAASEQRRIQPLLHDTNSVIGDHLSSCATCNSYSATRPLLLTAPSYASCFFSACQPMSGWCLPPPATRFPWIGWPCWLTRLWKWLFPQ